MRYIALEKLSCTIHIYHLGVGKSLLLDIIKKTYLTMVLLLEKVDHETQRICRLFHNELGQKPLKVNSLELLRKGIEQIQNKPFLKERSQPLQPDLARLSRIFWQRTSVQLSIFVEYQRTFIRRVLRNTGRLAYLVKLENTMIFRIVRKFRWNQQRFFRGIHFDFRFFAVQVATINRSTIMSPLYVWSAVSVWRP